MGPRYYWISALVVFGLTLIISFVTQKCSPKAVSLIFIKVILGLTVLVGGIAGLAWVLVFFGVAEDGFVL